MRVTFKIKDEVFANETDVGFLAEYKLVQFVQNLATEKHIGNIIVWINSLFYLTYNAQCIGSTTVR